MPMKDREAKPKRGEKLPPIKVFLSSLRTDIDAPKGNWECDKVIAMMDDRGWIKGTSLDGGPLRLEGVRALLIDAVWGAYASARATYDHKKERDFFRKRKLEEAQALSNVVSSFIEANAEDARMIENYNLTSPDLGSPVDFRAVDDARNLLRSLEAYAQSIRQLDTNTVGDTGDHLHAAFVREMLDAWEKMTGSSLVKGQKETTIRLSVATWIDLKMPNFEIGEAKLHARIKKWFQQSGKV